MSFGPPEKLTKHWLDNNTTKNKIRQNRWLCHARAPSSKHRKPLIVLGPRRNIEEGEWFRRARICTHPNLFPPDLDLTILLPTVANRNLPVSGVHSRGVPGLVVGAPPRDETGNPGIRGSRHPGSRESRDPGIPGFRNLGIPRSGNRESGNPEIQESGIWKSRIRESGISADPR